MGVEETWTSDLTGVEHAKKCNGYFGTGETCYGDCLHAEDCECDDCPDDEGETLYDYHSRMRDE